TGIAERQRQRIRQLVRIPYLATPDEIQRRVGDDAVEPRAERLIRPEAIQRAEGVQKSFLYGILGILMGEHDRARHGVRPTLMPPHELTERPFVSALRGDDEVAFAGPRAIISHRRRERQGRCALDAHTLPRRSSAE